MNRRDERAEFRGVVYRGEGGSLVSMLTRDPWPDHALQVIGVGLLGVLAARADGVEELARRCVIGLRERGWEGDRELADGIEAALGSGPVPLLRPLPVDLEELAGVLEGDPVTGGGRIDLRTGEVWPQPAIEYAKETGDFDEDEEDDEERWLWVECEGSHAGTATWSCSLPRSRTPARPTGSALPSAGGARSADSRTCCRDGQYCSTGGTPSARTASGVGLERGWPPRDTRPHLTGQGRDQQVSIQRHG